MQYREIGSANDPAGQGFTQVVVELSPKVLASQAVGMTQLLAASAKKPLGQTLTHLKLYWKRGEQLPLHMRSVGSAYCPPLQTAVQL